MGRTGAVSLDNLPAPKGTFDMGLKNIVTTKIK
jgi:hypothetical protein